jgi:hypothetical protein
MAEGSRYESDFVTQYIGDLAFADLWNSIRTCTLNVLFHRWKAREMARRATFLEIATMLLAAIAGAGIIELPSIRDSFWAVVAFVSAITGQLPAVFKLSDRRLENKRFENEYSSILADLFRVLNRAKATGGLTRENHEQFELALEKFHFVVQKDDTDYRPEEIKPLQLQVVTSYPPSKDWKPRSTLESIVGSEQ